MTTIVWKKGVLCADRLYKSNGMKLPLEKKLIHCYHNLAFAIAGYSRGQAEFHKWVLVNWPGIEKGEILRLNADDVPFSDDISYIIAIGKKLWYTDNDSIVQVGAPWFALGSGAPYASAALHLGHTASEAMQVAHALDPSTSKGFDKWVYTP
jgi:hypothetical protein